MNNQETPKEVLLSCPFCEFEDYDSEFLSQHVAYCHPEDPAASLPTHTHQDWAVAGEDLQAAQTDSLAALDNTDDLYIPCPHGCGEEVAKTELQLHLDLHVAESVALDETGDLHLQVDDGGQRAARMKVVEDTHHDFDDDNDDSDLHQDDMVAHGKDIVLKGKSTDNRQRHKKDVSKPSQHGHKGIRRLGRKELGPYAHEKQMPSWLQKLLLSGHIENTQTRIGPNGSLIKEKDLAENETSKVIPTLTELCRHDDSVQRAFICSPRVRHIFKFMREGGFCGYRNIQMLISHIIDARIPGHEHFSGRIPSILELQNMIEQAWDMGFNSSGRIETGGIKGTRNLGIKCIPGAFASSPGLRAHDMLLQDVATYFRSGCPTSLLESDEKILETNLPPIYLQHQGHSLTIIGFEINTAGSASLLVFDPMFRTSPAIHRLIGKFVKPSDPSRILKAWRRGPPYLQKYKEFEILKLVPE
ncbi:Zinc finger with UFM1-specific peptidase domain protein [Talaromyces pinophilus]|nr:Zinc finger with UFM1-specific peptidase domain protein [Talaromyces pinophilus]